MGISLPPFDTHHLSPFGSGPDGKGVVMAIDRGMQTLGVRAALPQVAVSPAGHEIPVVWAGVEGATEVEVSGASVRVAAPAEARIETAATTAVSEGFQLTVPAHRRLSSIGLLGAKRGDGSQAAIVSAGDLDSDRRLVIYAKDASGQMAARYAVPRVGARGGIPPQFGGASLDGGVISFPELTTTQLRVGLVDREATEDWDVQPFQLASQVNLTVVVVPADLALTTGEGAPLWSFGGELDDAAGLVEGDVAAPLQGALAQLLAQHRARKLPAGTPLAVTLSLTAANDATVGFRLTGPTGALIRRVPDVVKIDLAGESQPLVFPDLPLASERPTQVTADLVVRYVGIRLLDEVNDVFPSGRAVSGTIVGTTPVRRTLPPQALTPYRVARVGVIGRSPEGCELSVQLMDAGPSGAPLTAPGVCNVTAGDAMRVWWVDLVQQSPSPTPAVISVRATSGRFFWTGDPVPLARIAVHDPKPGGRPVRLGSGELARLTSDTHEAAGMSLHADAFAAPGGWFDSMLFVTIELGDLTLRYAR